MLTQTLSAALLATHTRLLGRWKLKPCHGVDTLYTTNLGSTLRFQIQRATTLTVNFFNNGNPFGAAQVIGIRVDDHPWQHFAANHMPATIHFAAAHHVIEIMTVGNTDLDNVWLEQEGFALQSITTDATAQIQPTPPRPHLTWIGDSITAGCWVHGRRPAQDYAADTNYAAQCSDHLACDSCRIAYSAAGIIRGGTGHVPAAPQFLTHLDQDTVWQPTATDLVVINLGVNDRQYFADDFERALRSFLHQVQDCFAAPIMVMVPFAQVFAPVFRAVIHELPSITLIETADWALTYTDRLHPDQHGSDIAGRRLAQVLRPYI